MQYILRIFGYHAMVFKYGITVEIPSLRKSKFYTLPTKKTVLEYWYYFCVGQLCDYVAGLYIIYHKIHAKMCYNTFKLMFTFFQYVSKHRFQCWAGCWMDVKVRSGKAWYRFSLFLINWCWHVAFEVRQVCRN